MVNDMVKEKSWDEFRSNGMLWWINQQLHLFGWAIVTDIDKAGNVSKAYPARVKFRGFNDETTTRGFVKLTQYLQRDIDSITEDLQEDIEALQEPKQL
jgi:hypothetical protein